MNSQIRDIIKTFESTSKNRNQKYNEFLAHVYATFDKHISLCRSDKMMNKYKKMRNSVLSYIVANERAITAEICKNK
jgi:hypothetical protein